ncbi:ISAs1 family transposase [Desmonostoc muscorum LEGE 12446]|uniref:ISAs1 family transposase n=1 Tax=Desmonostoc muscorum LEGE 12446 TaxID=1828758 RepID=A0A8J7DF37_DESMC|nr:ISAs1 family transposase [Desmonostoc muscorum]MCF2150813.1 ISAs1 family transposase [Desmonostoc muscorum LEGE 12446]MCF2151777.1 ISAs1 family transposase [Desmonostoc muscorum LEGE 12446]MCF2151845.1 ISAs1 family transposase [Desmonostoc muscorum LEGE 12446]
MKLKPKITIADHFLEIQDPRIDRTKRHNLIDIMTIAICAVICGADGWVAVETYGCAKYEWLKTFLELPNGIPSHDTFARVFAQINPQQFESCFINWMKSITKMTNGEVVAIDGKTLRGSYDKSSEQSAIQIVSAWATTSKLVLGQVKVDKKSNEITAIPELLKVLDLSGCIVTIDAIGCQKEIVRVITEQDADYVITLKKNQGNLYDEVEKLFQSGISTDFEGIEHSTYKTEEKGHSRHEIRHYVMLSQIQSRLNPDSVWSKFNSVGMVESVRSLEGKTTVETRYFISSLEDNAQQFGNSIRSHWGVENSLHWVLDVALKEDDCRIRKDNAPENFAILRHIAVNLLGQEKRVKRGIKNKQFLAGLDNNYLARVLALA